MKELIDTYLPTKTTTINPRFIIRDPWMTKGLMSSSRTSVKLYHKCMKKARDYPAFVKYIRYRNLYNSLKRQAKITYYDELFQKY